MPDKPLLTAEQEQELRNVLDKAESHPVAWTANLMSAALATIEALRWRVAELENAIQSSLYQSNHQRSFEILTAALNPDKEASE